jgi:hypothetical protein
MNGSITLATVNPSVNTDAANAHFATMRVGGTRLKKIVTPFLRFAKVRP